MPATRPASVPSSSASAMCTERRRRGARGSGAALGLACLIAAVAGCGSESEPSRETEGAALEAARASAPQTSVVPDDAIVPRPPPEPPAADTGGTVWLLALEVDQAQEIEVLPGTPLLFSVSLTAAGTGPPGRLGGAEKPWHSQVALEFAERGEPAPWKTTTLAAQSLVFEREGSGRGAVRDALDPEARVAPGHVHLATLAIAPDEAARISAGRHLLRAALVRSDARGAAARVVSDPVAIIVRERSDDPAEQAALEHRRLVAEADFRLRSGQFEEAQRIAAELAQRDPADARARELLGDAASAAGHDEQARDAYLEALALAGATGDLDEPPQTLIERLSEVQQRLVTTEDPKESP